MKKKKPNLTTQYIVLVCALLLVVNVLLGLVLMSQSGKAMRSMVSRHMLAVADTAAASLDGDLLESLTKEDFKRKSSDFRAVYDLLTKIKNAQEDSDIKYIYTVKKDGSVFVFTVDPDPVEPGEYGEPVVPTPSQQIAWEGTSCVDKETYQDEWGSFYTAWSPVKNSAGNVVGLVAVDFVADWYDQQVKAHTISVIIISGMSVIVGALMVFLLTRQLRRKIRVLNGEMLILSRNVEELSREIGVRPGEELPDDEDDQEYDTDSIGDLSGKVRVMQSKLKEYLDFVHEQAYTDAMTGVENKTAYLEYVRELNRKINEGTVAFAIAVFDVNGLKKTNDNFGHECGDYILTDAATLIREVFSNGRIFRIGGDEFIAVLEGVSESEVNKRLDRLQVVIADFNTNKKRYSMTLSFSGGGAVYRPGVDSDYKEVFKRADEAMYQNKANYYRQFGDRRKRRDDNFGAATGENK